MNDITLDPVQDLSIVLDSGVDLDISLVPVSDLLNYELDTSVDLDTDISTADQLETELETGILVQGSKVIVNPPDEPTDSMETIKVDGKTWDIYEKDPTVPPWAKAPTKPSYTAEEVGAVDVDNELAYAEIDRMFNAVFGI